jgi:hypothetical protein
MTNPTTPTKFGEVGHRLHAQGWRPIPLNASTKVPAEPGWNLRNQSPWDAADLSVATTMHFGDACGIAVPQDIVAVDCDVTDESAARRLRELADEHMGATPLTRVGMPPKWVGLWRSDGTVVSTKPHPIEVYSGSGQVAVFGWHAKAGKPYTWPNASPLDVRADDARLPLVSNADVTAFLAAAEPVLTNLRRARRGAGGGAGIGTDASTEMGRMLRAGVPFQHAARLVLGGAVGGGRHYAVRAVVIHGYNRGVDADQIDCVIAQEAPAELLDHVGDYVARCLNDFAPTFAGERWS